MKDALTTVVDDTEVKLAFARLAESISPSGRRRALGAIGRYGKSSTQMRFRTQVDPDGKPWPKSKRVLAKGGQTMRKTSRLRNSMSFFVDDGGVSWGTNVKYAAAVHEGYTDPQQSVKAHQRTPTMAWGRKIKQPKPGPVKAFQRRMVIPGRRFLGVSEADRFVILGVLREHVDVGRA